MTSLNVIENKISDIQKYLHFLDDYRQITHEQLLADNQLSAALERYLYLVTQASIDLAETIIAYKNFRKPRLYKEAFEILREQGLLDKDLTKSLQDMVGFRNILAHDYADIDYRKVAEIMQGGFKDIREFIKMAVNIK